MGRADDGVGDREPEAGTLPLLEASVEALEDHLTIRCRYPWSTVAHRQAGMASATGDLDDNLSSHA